MNLPKITNKIVEEHRIFYINDKLEFKLFFDPKIIDKETILKNFFESKDWVWYERVWEVKKVLNAEVSDDLREVRVETKI